MMVIGLREQQRLAIERNADGAAAASPEGAANYEHQGRLVLAILLYLQSVGGEVVVGRVLVGLRRLALRVAVRGHGSALCEVERKRRACGRNGNRESRERQRRTEARACGWRAVSER